jgi:PrcB C-terminal
MHRRSITLLAALLMTAGMGCQNQKMAMPATDPVPILRRASGSDMAVKTEPLEVTLINSADALTAAAGDKLAALAVDFAHESLLVLSLGEQPTGGYWVRMTAVQQGPGGLYVQGLVNVPGDGEQVTPEKTYPYDAVVIPKSADQMVHPEMKNVAGQKPPAEGEAAGKAGAAEGPKPEKPAPAAK